MGVMYMLMTKNKLDGFVLAKTQKHRDVSTQLRNLSDFIHTHTHTLSESWTTVFMFDRSLWKLSLALYGPLARWRDYDITLRIFTPLSAPRKQKQESTWLTRTAVPPNTHAHTDTLLALTPTLPWITCTSCGDAVVVGLLSI